MINSPDTLFSSAGAFRQAFEQGLGRLLDQAGLGAFILVLANANFDQHIHQLLEQRLHDRFSELQAFYRDALRQGRSLPDTADDLLVFLKLMTVGFGQLQTTRFRSLGPWEVQFNHVRSFRPARMTSQAVKGIRKDFDPGSFNFSKPFLQQEILWQGPLQKRDVSLFYNKFPFAELHCLLVPEPGLHKPQFLQQADHDYIWELTGTLAETIANVGFGYNSYGALASVNHLHFQLFVRDQQLPVDDGRWQHNGGKDPYPLPCWRFDSMTDAWHYLAHLHEKEISYNLVYLPGRLYCLPRKKQGSYQQSDWTGGFAWHEMAGCVTTFAYEDFETLTAGQVSAELAMLAPVSQ